MINFPNEKGKFIKINIFDKKLLSPFFAIKWRFVKFKQFQLFISYKRVQNFNLEICTNNRKFKQREREKTFNCIPPKKKKKEKQFFNKTQYSYLLAYLHTRVCLYVLTFHPKVAFHIRLILSSVVLSSKIKFVPSYEIEGKIGRKKNGLPNETISYFARITHRYRLSLNELRKIPISICFPCALSLSCSPSYYVTMMDH